MSQSLYVIAGEMSGDAHAAGLLESLLARKPDLQVVGAGGPKMRAVAGDRIRDWVDQAGVMGVVEVLKHFSYFKSKFEEMLSEITELRPDVLLLVDYPGFNFRFAAAVREKLPDTKIVQYVCPQVWAWKKGRIPKMVKLFDEVLCLLPFEPEIFHNTKLKATFVGHPLVDELEGERISVVRGPKVVALLPGSRDPEVEKLFPMMLETAERMSSTRPDLVFEVPAARASLRKKMEDIISREKTAAKVVILDGGAHELMQRAACGVVASGTATVEAAYYGLPYCLVYKLAWPTYLIAKIVVKIPLIGLINILAKEEVIEEYVQSEADPCKVATALGKFLDDPDEVARLQKRLAEVISMLGGTGAHDRAASAVAGWFS